VLDPEATLQRLPALLLDEARQKLRGVRAELLLEEGGAFRAQMDIAGAGRSLIAGSWELAGEAITLRMTRQNDQPYDEAMSGTLVRGVLTLEGGGTSGRMTMVMRRQ
jgi:hypothetical protein